MRTMQEIWDGETLLGIVWRKTLRASGARFLTPQNFTLQVGLLEHPKGKTIRAHRHPNLKYRVGTTQEFLFIQKGKVEATLYRNDWSVVKKIVLSAGDFLLTIAGGHGFRILQKARIIEIKQGPYPGDAKAKIFIDERSR